MRQIHVQVRREKVTRVLEMASDNQAFSPLAVDATGTGDEEWSAVFLNLPNDRVGVFVRAVGEAVEDAQITLFPVGVLPIRTPLSSVHERVREVAPRSTLELVVGSLQSIGSWRGMLLYALFSGIVAAYGVVFGVSYLLVAAMLIAPMGAPAMVSVIGTAVGDPRMVGRGALRFFAALAVLVATAAAFGLLHGMEASTALMEQVTALSSWGVVVALVAGAAGAQSQVESDRSSLVTGTATGFLIAAALSPTSAVLGLSLVLRRWDDTRLMAFQLLLQYVAIVAGGWLSLLLYRVRPGDPSVGRGSRRARALLAAAALAATVVLAAWQLAQDVTYRKADVASRATELARGAVRAVPGARLVESSARFTRPDLAGEEETLLLQLVVEDVGERGPEAALESAVREAAVERLREVLPGVRPFVQVTVLPGPGGDP